MAVELPVHCCKCLYGVVTVTLLLYTLEPSEQMLGGPLCMAAAARYHVIAGKVADGWFVSE